MVRTLGSLLVAGLLLPAVVSAQPAEPTAPTPSPGASSAQAETAPVPPPRSIVEPPPRSIVAPPPPSAPGPLPVAAPPGEPPSPAPSGFAEAKTRVEKRIPDYRFVINNLFVFRWNPLGLEDQIRAGYQVRLYKSYDAMFRDNFIHFGVYPRINPAYIKIGPSLEIQPLSIFNLRVGAEYIEFFSTFGFLQSFKSPLTTRDGGLTDYSDTALQNNRNMKKNYSTSGIHVMIEPSVQLQLGPIVFRNKFMAEFWKMKLNPGDTVSYDVTLDTLVQQDGWVIANDMDLMWSRNLQLRKIGNATIRLGVRWSTVQPFYTKSAFRTKSVAPDEEVKADEDPSKAQNGQHRLGPVMAFTFFDRGFTRFNKPTLLVIANWYVKHQYRTGGDTSTPTAMPYIVVAFAFQSDLMQ